MCLPLSPCLCVYLAHSHTQVLLHHKCCLYFRTDDLVPNKYYQHQIHLLHDARPVQQRRYRMNPNYAAKVKEEIDKLLRVGFIRPVKRATWLSPVVVVPKKNGKIYFCVDYRKLNTATVTDGFPLPFTDSVLDTVASHEC